jgi:hypothetical protein
MEETKPRMGRMRDVEKYCPTFSFEIGSVYDFPSTINLGDFCVDARPTIYSHLRWDCEWLYAYYCIYHYRDNHHRHDFTGVMSAYYNGQYHCSVLRDHFRLVLHLPSDGMPVFTVREGTHSIVHYDPRFDKNLFVPAWRFDEIMLGGAGTRAWLQEKIGPWATPPWLWDDTKLKTRIVRDHVRREYGLKTTRGLLWSNPLLVVDLLQKYRG